MITRNSADTQSLVIDFIPGTLATDSIDGVVANLAAALAILQNFIDSTPNDTVSSTVHSIASRADTSLVDGVKGRVTSALLTNIVDSEVGLSTVTLSSQDVVNFISIAGNSADSKIRVIEGVSGALLADSVYEVEARNADTLTIDFNGINILAKSGTVGKFRRRLRKISVRNTFATVEDIVFNAVTCLLVLVIDGIGGASSTHSVNSLESSNTDTGQRL